MNVIPQSKVSSFPTLIRTLDNDFYSWRWFSYLLAQPPVKTALILEKDMPRQYRALARIERQELLLAGILLLSWAGLLTPFRIPVAVLLCFGLWVSSYLTTKKKAIITQISTRWLQKEFLPGDFEQKTLYQISEIISKKYKVTSLVDAVYFSDTVFRILYLGWFVLLLVPYPIPNFFIFAGASVFAVILLRNILNSRRIYQSHRMIDMI
ncbi:MAG: hypothetical protein WC450_03720 [Candidatus Omnitrophota bacterium]|jgi:hypothetical protein